MNPVPLDQIPVICTDAEFQELVDLAQAQDDKRDLELLEFIINQKKET